MPELFSIIGHERLILLAKYAGGETVRIPTIDELAVSIDSLQWFYDVCIKHCKEERDVPQDVKPLFYTIVRIYDARNSEEADS